MALEEIKKKRQNPDGTYTDEKDDRSMLKGPGGLTEQKKGIPKSPTAVQPQQQVVQQAPPEEIGPVVTTVTPIDDNAPQLRGGTPIAQKQPNGGEVEVLYPEQPQQTPQQPQQPQQIPNELRPQGTNFMNTQEGDVVQTQAGNTPQQGQTGSTPQAASVQQNVPMFRKDPNREAEFAKEVQSWGLNGNVDHLNRPMVSGKVMRQMGWPAFGSPEAQASTATVYTSRWTFSQGGKEHNLVVTPIGADGQVLSPDTLEDYVNWLCDNSKTPEEMLALDKNACGLLVGVDVPEGMEQRIHQAHQRAYLGTPGDYQAWGDAMDVANANIPEPVFGDPSLKSPYGGSPIDELRLGGQGITDTYQPQGIANGNNTINTNNTTYTNNTNNTNNTGNTGGTTGTGTPSNGTADVGTPTIDYYELQKAEAGDDTLDPHYRAIRDEMDAAEKQYNARQDFWNDPNNTMYGRAADAYNEGLKEEGLDEESEKRLQKRNRVSRIIANIGDVLQGFANLAGTWYGANSQKLTSLSEAVGAGQKEITEARQKRRDTLKKNYEDEVAKIQKRADKELSQLHADLLKANERYNKYLDDVAKEERRLENAKKLEEKRTEERGKQEEKKTEERGKVIEKNLSAAKEKIAAQGKETRLNQSHKGSVDQATARVRGEEQRRTKQTPSASSRNRRNNGAKSVAKAKR